MAKVIFQFSSSNQLFLNQISNMCKKKPPLIYYFHILQHQFPLSLLLNGGCAKKKKKKDEKCYRQLCLIPLSLCLNPPRDVMNRHVCSTYIDTQVELSRASRVPRGGWFYWSPKTTPSPPSQPPHNRSNHAHEAAIYFGAFAGDPPPPLPLFLSAKRYFLLTITKFLIHIFFLNNETLHKK